MRILDEMTAEVEQQIDETQDEAGEMEQRLCNDFTKLIPWMYMKVKDHAEKTDD